MGGGGSKSKSTLDPPRIDPHKGHPKLSEHGPQKKFWYPIIFFGTFFFSRLRREKIIFKKKPIFFAIFCGKKVKKSPNQVINSIKGRITLEKSRKSDERNG